MLKNRVSFSLVHHNTTASLTKMSSSKPLTHQNTNTKNIFVAIDFDGTLFLRKSAGGTGTITERDTTALQNIKNLFPNTRVALASGRNLLSLCRTLGIRSHHHSDELHQTTRQGSIANDFVETNDELLTKNKTNCAEENRQQQKNQNQEQEQQQQQHVLPVDYVILGAGSVTMKWPSQEIIRSTYMSTQVAFRIAQRLILGDVLLPIKGEKQPQKHPFSFFLLKGAPFMDESVHFICERDEKCKDNSLGRSGFEERLRTYAGSTTRVFASDFIVDNSPGAAENKNNNNNEDNSSTTSSNNSNKKIADEIELIKKFHQAHGQNGFSQFIVLFENRDDPMIQVADELVSEAVHADPLHGHDEDVSKSIRVSHTTSPVDHKAVWLEIFPSDISKSTALDLLEKDLFGEDDEGKQDEHDDKSKNCNNKNSNVTRIAVGNDHNDEDMLLWGARQGHGYLVNGSPQSIVDRHADGPHPIVMLKEKCGGGVAEALERSVVMSDETES